MNLVVSSVKSSLKAWLVAGYHLIPHRLVVVALLACLQTAMALILKSVSIISFFDKVSFSGVLSPLTFREVISEVDRECLLRNQPPRSHRHLFHPECSEIRYVRVH